MQTSVCTVRGCLAIPMHACGSIENLVSRVVHYIQCKESTSVDRKEDARLAGYSVQGGSRETRNWVVNCNWMVMPAIVQGCGDRDEALQAGTGQGKHSEGRRAPDWGALHR